jgi:hypothetical protein
LTQRFLLTARDALVITAVRPKRPKRTEGVIAGLGDGLLRRWLAIQWKRSSGRDGVSYLGWPWWCAGVTACGLRRQRLRVADAYDRGRLTAKQIAKPGNAS